MFSQGESILNRSWIPTQDSPGIRQTWEAAITVPAPLTAVMSAEMLTPEGEPGPNGTRRFRFRMDKPVAPYLIALAVGDLDFQATGPRTGVWAEPVTLPKAADEFADLEKMVTTAEGLYGPYRWGRYDLLVLPPAFPFGGMENPRLTFVTPTVLAGDRSLTSLVAHELAHSWSGNLVTNATWDDFWLNEGFTVYFETRIMEALYGRERSAMLADLGWSDLQSALKDNAGPDTALHLDLTGRDPDDGLTDIAYEKGATFLRTLEAAVGRERWDRYLTGYFNRHAFQPQTTTGFRADLLANLFGGDEAAMARVDVDQWLYQPGLPANAVHITSPAFAKVDALAAAFATGGAAPSGMGRLDHAGAAALPGRATPPVARRPAGRARPHLWSERHGQQRTALRLAAAGAPQRLPARARLGGAVSCWPRGGANSWPRCSRPCWNRRSGARRWPSPSIARPGPAITRSPPPRSTARLVTGTVSPRNKQMLSIPA